MGAWVALAACCATRHRCHTGPRAGRAHPLECAKGCKAQQRRGNGLPPPCANRPYSGTEGGRGWVYLSTKVPSGSGPPSAVLPGASGRCPPAGDALRTEPARPVQAHRPASLPDCPAVNRQPAGRIRQDLNPRPRHSGAGVPYRAKWVLVPRAGGRRAAASAAQAAAHDPLSRGKEKGPL